MVREFLGWWLGQLADLVPDRWRRAAAGNPEAAVIAPVGRLADGIDAIAVSLRRNGRETPLGDFHIARDELADIAEAFGKTAVLRLGESDVLAKTLVLPLAAERDIEQVVAFEMDRETPFAADEVYWSGRITRRDRATGQLWVRLLMVPRARLQALVAALAAIGIRPRRAEIADGPDRDSWLPLDAAATAPHEGSRRLLRPALAACLLLAAAAVLTPFIRQSLALGAAERATAGERAAAEQARQLRKEIDRLSGGADAIEAEQAKSGRPLAIIAAVTQLLPSDTYLTDFIQQQGKITLTGRSAAASRLIAILAADQRLRNPTFAAPVTRIAADRQELFTITAEVAP